MRRLMRVEGDPPANASGWGSASSCKAGDQRRPPSMLRTFLILVLALAGCSPEPERPPRPRQTGPGLLAPIVLPNGDGRVYIIEMHDELGIETQKCLVHVSDSGSSTACPPSQLGSTP